MIKYELVVITHPEKTEEQLQEITDGLKSFIEKEGGSIELIEQWGKRKLSYLVKKNRFGYYTMFHYDGPSDIVAKLELHMKHNESVIKYITLNYDPRTMTRPTQAETSAPYSSDRGEGRRDNFRRG